MGEELSLSEILRRIEAGVLRPEEGLELMNARFGDAEAAAAPPARVDLVSRAVQLLKSVLAAQTKLPLDAIDPEEPFESYGIDSTMIVGLNRRLEQYFGELSKTIFFEHRSISQMALYLSRQYAAELEKLGEPGEAPQPGPGAATDPVRSRFLPAQGAPVPAVPATGGEIAIIGLSGRYPQARNLAEFWANLKQGKDCVTEIPPDRWDWRRNYNPDPNRRDTVYTKWGGFLADADKFDPLFFQITPREAEVIDPQERLFLQTAWHTFEDAGYTRDRVAKQKVGVFVGVMYGQYQIYGTDVDPQALVPTSSHASVANRVSFSFDLRGPSMAVDSMCSSSLTAIHMACESLRRGESEMALAGGVNLSLHPLKYRILSQQRFASTDGRCRAFGEGGDGYVPGEGVGAVLLKPLERAIADGDHIYAVIKAGVINHGGRTHGYSVPNPNAQAELITEALERSGIHPRTISYIEAHGTGTSLGDPIEITGLTGAFSARTPEKQFCAIGSVKSSVGHLEAAAGIAGLTKVLLQMQHGELVPSLHADQLNPNIAFHNSPFYVQRTLTPWQRPVVAENGRERTYPRRAGLSAFGAGGTNVHLLLEEYCPAAAATGDMAPVIIPLSARNQERLLEAAAQLRAHLELMPGARLCDIAYTLQVGREPMEERLALVVSSRDELLEKLALVAGDGEAIPGCYQGQAVRTNRTQAPAMTGDLAELARGWAAGQPVDWESLYGDVRPARISLPGYPFARERYWVRTRSEAAQAEAPAEAPVSPLLPQFREAGADGQRFEQTLQQDQFVLRDHVVAGKQMLPGVAYLEIARAAAAQAGGRPVRRIRNLVWERPVILEEQEAGLFTRLGGGRFEIRSRSGLHASGEYIEGEAGEAGTSGTLDLTELRRRCPQVRTHAEIYRQLERIGFAYGPGFRVTRELRCGEWEALAELRLPAHLQSDFPAYGLHPSLMDGALRAALGIGSMLFADAPVLRVPFALDELEILQPLTEDCFAYAVIPPEQRTGGGELVKCNITIVSPAGAELVRIKGFAARPLKAAADQELLFYAPRWVEQKLDPLAAVSLPHAVLLLADDQELGNRLEPLLSPARLIRVGAGAQYAQQGPHQFTIRPQAPEDYRQMLQALRAQGLDSFQIAHCLNLAQTGAEPGLEPVLNAGLWSLLHLFQAVHGLGLQSRSRCLFAYAGAPGTAAAAHGAVAGFARSLLPVSDRFELITLQVDDAPADLAERLSAELAAPGNHDGEQVAYAGGVRHLQQLVPVDVPTSGAPQFRTGGVYLITGGAGSLGMAVARHLAREYQAALVLLGRSAATPAIAAALAELKALGADAVYHSADVADLAAVQGAVAQAKARFGRLDGIIHCAGIVGSTPVTQADPESFMQILAPKLLGTLNLDQATRDEKLELFLLFSSVSAILGDFGSCSYATANAFLDRFAAERTRLCSQGLRHGRTLSVDWPWWDAGGMSLPREEAELYKAHLGMRPLPTEQGLRAMELALATGLPQVAVAFGEPGRISRAFKVTTTDGPGPATVHAAPAPAASAAGNDWLLEQTVLFLKNAVSEVTRLPLARIDAQTDLEQYGLDSVMVMELSRRLEQELGALPRTLFFEFRNLRALAAHLCETHGEQLAARFGAPQPAHPETAVGVRPAAAPAHPAPAAGRPEIPVAIIGVSGRYPMAADLDQFWENLRTGRDCITEIPRSRWDNSRFYDPQKGKKGKIYCQYGGFIDDADRFDPLFFRISPREATLLDPQERLFLQTVWQTVEDAGYTRSSLKQARVGVFVGAMYSHYQLHGVEETQAGRAFAATSFFSSIANRVSYFMDFAGPSLALDTACSSSLEALRLAYEHIRSGQCEMAIAGGVNLTLHPNKYIFLCQSSFLSPDGRCHSFGAGGDGYVPGEGVGAVLLKPLDRAVADGDHIYAVIRGAAVGHGGKSNGYSVPTPAAQARVISEALQQSGVDPQTISYIEAHGTGTALGDPIEVTGLTRAFAGAAGGGQVCALGSVKSNIGHLEAAAGIAGITKVLLQLQHKQLVPSLHSRSLNPNIDFAGTPFRVQQELAPWQPPVACPRRAGVSAFGAGGTNVHIILEEYVAEAALPAAEAPQLILLSAQTADRLRARAEQLIRYLDAPDQGADLAAIACTLQVGREHMEHRLALIGHSRDEVRAKLLQFLQGEGEKVSWWRGELTEQLFEQNDREEQEYLQAILQKGNLEKLARLWVSGAAVDWAALSPGARRRRVSLPAYPFQGERYWLAIDPQSGSAQSVGRLHPLIDVNASTLQETCFRKVLTGDDFVLRAHDVAGQLVLPGAAVLEMARAAGELAGLHGIRQLQDVVWAVPVLAGEVSLSLMPEQGGAAFQVYSRKGDDRVVHARGHLLQSDAVPNERLPVHELLSRCTLRMARAELYESLRQSGFNYGPEFQVTEELLVGEAEAVARLALPELLTATAGEWGLHPSLLDGALRAVGGTLAADRSLTGRTFVPFSLGRLEIIRPLAERCLAHAVRRPESADGLFRFDLTVMDEQGDLLLRLRDFCVREFRAPAGSDARGSWYYRMEWQAAAPAPAAGVPAGPVLLLDGDAHRRTELERLWPGGPGIVLVTPGTAYRKVDDRHYVINPAEPADYVALLGDLADRPAYVLHLWNLNGEGSTDRALDLGVHSAQFILQAVTACGWEHRIRALFAHPLDAQPAVPWHAMLSGFARSLTTVNHRFELISLQTPRDAETSALAAELLNPGNGNGTEIRRAPAGRAVRTLLPLDAPPAGGELPLRPEGVYLITGGAGGIGMLLARYLARRCRARVVLVGRSPLSEKSQGLLDELGGLGGEGLYLQADITRPEQAAEAVQQAKARFGRLNGLFHCAGVLGETPVTRAGRSDFARIYAPKVQGTVNLDLATREEPLDFLILFSSVAALLGDFGACAYAAGNSFMDGYAEYREQLRCAGQRSGRCLSVNWPLWQTGGMQLRGEESSLYAYSGMQMLTEADGLAALGAAWQTGLSQVVVMSGDQAKIERTLRIRRSGAPAVAEPEAPAGAPVRPGGEEPLHQRAERYLKEQLAGVLGLPLERIHPRTELVAYGIDSVTVMEVSSRMERDFGPLPKTLLFEYNTVGKLAGWLVSQYPERVAALPGAATGGAREAAVAEAPAQAQARAAAPTQAQAQVATPAETQAQPPGDEPIAVVGLGLRFPMAEDSEQFWSNLKQGLNCITEVPKERWNHAEFYEARHGQPGKAYSRWGGFVSDVDKFDPLAFNISPLEAEAMDPQERIFLEVAWASFEDGGISRREVQAADHKVGVFVGVMNCNYEWLGAVAADRGLPTNAHSAYWSIANRISFLFDFRGPSMAVDSACSSSLTAIHLACESIRRGECHMAVAGGVNLILHPAHYVRYSMMNMISEDHQCRSFGKDADGFVPGEGAGAVVLKPLRDAIRDGNQIYGVIRGSMVNAGGTTNGYTVPNPNAQAGLISDALSRAEIHPRSISYVEAHGTGTALGDPIEIRGLTKAYSQHTQDRQYCPIGSVKSNIGHLEAASGVSGLIKVLLQMKHRQLAPSIGADEVNPHIEFIDSPFYVQRQLAPWAQPVIVEGGQAKRYPRRAGVSSFGAGGANAHVIVEEYQPQVAPAGTADAPQIVVLSARTEERLRTYAAKLSAFLELRCAAADSEAPEQLRPLVGELIALVAETVGSEPAELDPAGGLDECGLDQIALADLTERVNLRFSLGLSTQDLAAFPSLEALAGHLLARQRKAAAAATRELTLARLAYTLQSGRQVMKHRLALVAGSLEELMEKLRSYSGRQDEMTGIYTGHGAAPELPDEESVAAAIRSQDLIRIAQLWAAGATVDWELLHPGARPIRVSLPTYPFERQRHWLAGHSGPLAMLPPAAGQAGGQIHPLVDRNCSTFREHRFVKRLTGQEFYLLQGDGQAVKLLPGLVLLEVARVAGTLGWEQPVSRIRNVVWADPPRLAESPRELQISFYPDGDQLAWFEVSATDTGGIYAQGQILLAGAAPGHAAEPVELDAVRRRCTDQGLGAEVKTALQRMRWSNALCRSTVRDLQAGPSECLARLEIPEGLRGDLERYSLHPALLTATWLVAAAWLHTTDTQTDPESGAGMPAIPAALSEAQLLAPLPAQCYLYLTTAENGALTVRLLDAAGNVAFRMTDLATDRYVPEAAPIMLTNS